MENKTQSPENDWIDEQNKQAWNDTMSSREYHEEEYMAGVL